MTRTTVRTQAGIILLLTIFTAYVFSDGAFPFLNSSDGLLHVVYLDVGQGDATLIETPSGKQVLIDGGPTEVVLRGLRKELGFFDRDIDMVIATHPDQDHIGGLVDVLRRYRVHTILITENKSTTAVSDLLRKLIDEEGATIRYARTGQLYDLGLGESGSTTFRILFPDRDPSELESNTSSIISQLIYGDIEFMFTGDSPIAIEEYLVRQGVSLRSEVLKAGHHGSRTSTSQSFLDAVHPLFGIISAGKDNKYGHPHAEVTQKLKAAGVEIKNTAESGSIEFLTDGKTVWAN